VILRVDWDLVGLPTPVLPGAKATSVMRQALRPADPAAPPGWPLRPLQHPQVKGTPPARRTCKQFLLKPFEQRIESLIDAQRLTMRDGEEITGEC